MKLDFSKFNGLFLDKSIIKSTTTSHVIHLPLTYKNQLLPYIHPNSKIKSVRLSCALTTKASVFSDLINLNINDFIFFEQMYNTTSNNLTIPKKTLDAYDITLPKSVFCIIAVNYFNDFLQIFQEGETND